MQSGEPQIESTVKPFWRLIPLCARRRNRVFLAIDGVAASTQSLLVTVCMVLSPCAWKPPIVQNSVTPPGVPRQQSRLRSMEHVKEHHHAEATNRVDKRREERDRR